MKLLQFSDLHLGMENFGRVNPSTGVHSRLVDFLAALDQVVTIAEAEQVDAVLFAGDAYRTRDPSPTVQRELAKRLRRLTKGGVPVVMLVGNHDVPNAEGRANTLDVFAALEIPGLVVSRRPERLAIETKSGPLQIVTLPWVNPALYLTDQTDRPDEQVLQERLLADMEQLWDALLDEAAGQPGPVVALVHGAIEGAVYQGKTSIFKGSDVPLPKLWFTRKPLSYTAVGHIHGHQVLSEQPPIVYAGSIEMVDWLEEADEKGIILIELESSKTREYSPHVSELTSMEIPAKFWLIPIETRPIKTIRVILLGDNPTELILQRLQHEQLEGAIVRLVLEGTKESRKLTDERRIRQELRRAHYSSGIIWELHKPEAMKQRSRDLASRSDEELLRLWGERKNLPKAQVEAYLALYEGFHQPSAVD